MRWLSEASRPLYDQMVDYHRRRVGETRVLMARKCWGQVKTQAVVEVAARVRMGMGVVWAAVCGEVVQGLGELVAREAMAWAQRIALAGGVAEVGLAESGRGVGSKTVA